MLSLTWCFSLLAILYCTRADKDYSCARTQNNAITANLMCQYSASQSFSTCGRYCTNFAPVDQYGWCVATAYDCRGGCDMESRFRLMVGGLAHNAPEHRLDCCNVTSTENAIVCAKCGFGSSAYYQDFAVKLVKGCICSACNLPTKTTDKVHESIRELFSHENLTSSEVISNHG